jgi:hypothetical protein
VTRPNVEARPLDIRIDCLLLNAGRFK